MKVKILGPVLSFQILETEVIPKDVLQNKMANNFLFAFSLVAAAQWRLFMGSITVE